jgi:hypothetical protein
VHGEIIDTMMEIQDLIANEIKENSSLCKPKTFMEVSESLSEFKSNSNSRLEFSNEVYNQSKSLK